MHIAKVLSGKAGAPGIQAFLTSRQVRRDIRSAVSTLLRDGCRVKACYLRREKFKPNRKLTAYFDVWLQGKAEHQSDVRPIEVTWTPVPVDDSSRTTAVLEMEGDALKRGVATPFYHLSVSIGNMRIQVSPLDPSFPQLARVSDPQHLGNLFGSQCAITPVRYRPGQRHVLRYDLPPAAGSHGETVFAKLYADAESSGRAFRVACRVADRVADGPSRVAAVRPLDRLGEDALVVYPRVPGTPLSRYLQTPTRAVMYQINCTGRVLRALHDAEIPTSDLIQHTFRKELKAIERASEHVQVLVPSVGRTILNLLEQALELYEQLQQESPTCCHADFKADHLFVSRKGITLIDFDSVALGDPALDLGKFMADLKWWYVFYRQPGAEQADQAFLNGYGADVPSERLARARVYEAIQLVKMTVRRVRLSDKNWSERTHELIKRAGHLLLRSR